jgi:hypothetical protein
MCGPTTVTSEIGFPPKWELATPTRTTIPPTSSTWLLALSSLLHLNVFTHHEHTWHGMVNS